MRIITDDAILSDTQLLQKIQHGAYILQDSKHPDRFRTGAIGTKEYRSGAMKWLQRSAIALQRSLLLAMGWRYVFFVQTASYHHVYAIEAVLNGRICEAFSGGKKSQFSIKPNDDLERVKHVAELAMAGFMLHMQYRPTVLLERDDAFKDSYMQRLA